MKTLGKCNRQKANTQTSLHTKKNVNEKVMKSGDEKRTMMMMKRKDG